MFITLTKLILAASIAMAAGMQPSPDADDPESASDIPPRFGVYVGDSVSSGYPLVGRLNPRAGAFFPSTTDQAGQPSYEMTELTGYPWINNGIAGQTTVEIAARWCRDVLDWGCDPRDGLGSDTLDGKPAYVIVSAGINDLFKGVDPQTTRDNLTAMVKSAVDSQIEIVVYTTFMFGLPKGPLKSSIDDLNRWIIANVPKLGGHVYRYDYFAFRHGMDRTSFFSDKLHPNEAGNERIAKEIYNLFPYLRQGV